MRGVKIVSTSETVDEMDRTTLKDNDGKKFQENSPLYSRMSWTMHFLIFLYACAFWIQVGAFPVNLVWRTFVIYISPVVIHIPTSISCFDSTFSLSVTVCLFFL